MFEPRLKFMPCSSNSLNSASGCKVKGTRELDFEESIKLFLKEKL